MRKTFHILAALAEKIIKWHAQLCHLTRMRKTFHILAALAEKNHQEACTAMAVDII